MHICITCSSTWPQAPWRRFVSCSRGTALSARWMLRKRWDLWVGCTMHWRKGKGQDASACVSGASTRGARCMWRQGLIVPGHERRPGLGWQEDHGVRGKASWVVVLPQQLREPGHLSELRCVFYQTRAEVCLQPCFRSEASVPLALSAQMLSNPPRRRAFANDFPHLLWSNI